MNILVVCHYGLYQDLTASFVHAQAKAYAALGHRVRVIIPVPVGKVWEGRRLGPFQAVRQDGGVELYYTRFLSLSNFGERWFNTVSAGWSVRLFLGRLLADFTPDVIHAHTLGLNSQVGAWLKRRLGRPLVVTTHGSDTFVPYMAGDKELLKRYADKADQVVCVSSFLQKRLLDCGVTAPTQVILNGFHVRHMEAGVEKPPYSMVQAGYLVERKKADVTIRACAKLRQRYPEMTLEIIGSGDQMARYQDLCRELGVADGVCFRGFLPNAETLAEMAKARFFVMPSVREGFGIVYLEAMAGGCVTIGTEGEGIADLIVSGENGFLVPPDDPEAIVRVVEWCLDHPAEADTIAQRGRRDALGLTWARNAQQYISLFRSLTKTEEI